MNRRQFLVGTAAVAVAPALPALPVAASWTPSVPYAAGDRVLFVHRVVFEAMAPDLDWFERRLNCRIVDQGLLPPAA
jgi:hypothetical protein